MSRRHHLASSLIWLTLAEILFNISGYIIHSVAGRILGPADYGRYSLVITLTTILVVLIGNGIPTAMSRYLSEAFEKNPSLTLAIKRQGIRLQTILMGGVTVLFFLSAPSIALVLGDPSLTPLFRFSSLIIPAFAASSFYFYYFTGIHLFRYQAFLKMLRSVLRIVVTVSFIVFFGLNGAIAGYIVVPFLTFLAGIYLDYKVAIPTHPGTAEFPWKKMMEYAWPLTLFLLFYELFISVDLYLVKMILRDDYSTGLYNAALTLGRVPYYLFYALSIVLLPALAKMNSERNHVEMRALMTQSLRYAGIILLPVFVLLFRYAEASIDLLFGSGYATPETVVSLQTLAFGLSFLTVFYLIASALNGIGHARSVMWMTLLALLMNIGLNWWAIGLFHSIFGAAFATTVTSFLVTGIALYLLFQVLPITLSGIPIVKTLAASVVLWYAASFFPATDWRFIPYSILLGAGYVGLLFLVRVLGWDDWNRLFRKKLPEIQEIPT